MLGDDELGPGDAAQDVFGEVCNTIAGSFKGGLPASRTLARSPCPP